MQDGCTGMPPRSVQLIASIGVITNTIAGVLIPSVIPAQAQITPDGTLGNERSIVSPDRTIRQLPGILIEGGARRGGNLFQSFSDFNIGEGQRVYFANPAGIANILSRVTGRNPSRLLGTLGVDGSANLFFLNPNGILFGRNARLDIAGSFIASTADNLTIGDNLPYSATQPEAPLLTMTVPPGLQYGAQGRGPITNEGMLAVGANQRLALLGNQVTSSGSLLAPGGQVELLGDRVALLNQARVDVSGTNGGGTVLVGGDLQGKGQVPTARQTRVDRQVVISADALTRGNGGKVIVWADGTTRFSGTITAKGGSSGGNGGFVEVSGKQHLDYTGWVDASAPRGTAGTLLLDPTNIFVVADGGTTNLNAVNDASDPNLDADGTRINVSAINNATAQVILQASNNITFDAPISITRAGIGLQALAGNDITVNRNIITNGGLVSLVSQTGTVQVNNSIIQTSARLAGAIVLRGQAGVSLTNSEILSRSNSGSNAFSAIGIAAPAGSVTIRNTLVSATNTGTGLAGDVVITASDQVNVTDSGVFARGNFGRIFIGRSPYTNFDFSPQGIQIVNSRLETSNDSVPVGSTADAGRVILTSSGQVTLTNANLLSTAAQGRQGSPGGIGIVAQSLTAKDTEINTSKYSQGGTASTVDDRGKVILLIEDDAEFIRSTVFNNVESGGSGQGGVILVLAESLALREGSQIQTIVRGNDGGLTPAQGDAGDIFVQVADRLTIDGTREANGRTFGSAISSSVDPGARGNGGSIFIQAKQVALNQRGFINVSNRGISGRAGDLEINAKFITLDRKAFIAGISNSGQGGDILLRAKYLVSLTRTSTISTSSGSEGSGGNGGRIKITGLEEGEQTLFVFGAPFRNNDILAEAFGGQGGSIRVEALYLRQLAARPEDPDTNDISTKSFRNVDGTFATNAIDGDPSRGTTPLPDRYKDPRIGEGCDPRDRSESSKFIITGQGGLPTNPTSQVSPNSVTSWLDPTGATSQQVPAPVRSTQQPNLTEPEELIVAQGFSIAPNGEIILSRHSANGELQPPWYQPPQCPAPNR